MQTSARKGRLASLARCTFACGTRGAYVRGCRCGLCREANTLYAREREVRRRRRVAELAAAGALETPPAPESIEKPWTTRSGEVRPRRFRRPCPGVMGEPCASQSYLRKDSLGGVCSRCRLIVTYEGDVPADRAREHLRRMSREGIGRRAVADASDVASSSVHMIKRGEASRIRARTERKLLDVDEGCRADASPVPAGATWRRVRELLEQGWTQAEIARVMGYARPALQLGRRRVLLRNADRIDRLAAKVQSERSAARRACPRCGRSHEDDPLALRWCLEHLEVPLSREERLQTVPTASEETT